jgi:hypothetical protein
VADRCVLMELTKREREDIGAGALSMDQKIRDYVRKHFAFRYIKTDDYTTAMRLEKAVKAGSLGNRPLLNP